MPVNVGDIIEKRCTVAGVTLAVRYEVDAVGPDDAANPDPEGPFMTDGTATEFALLDRRTPEQVTDWEHRYNSQQLDLAAQYVSADPDNPTWHPITGPLKRVFTYGEGPAMSAGRR